MKTLRLIFILILFATFSCKKTAEIPNKIQAVYVKNTHNGYTLVRNGKPYYIKGGAGNGSLEELKKIGGNTIRVYDTINLDKILKKADSLGLAVIVDIPLPQYNKVNFKIFHNNFSKTKNKIQNLVSKYKNSPSLLYWNLGNEVLYPELYKNTDFFKDFNILINTIKEIDHNHPVSTAIIGGSRSRLLSVAFKSSNLDFISINTFGSLTNLKKSLNSISLVWEGPYVISEWGINGPWEEEVTTWGAPLEKTNTKKAEIIRNRYYSDLLTSPDCMGSIYFYWGMKQERTSTWFSTFSEDGEKNEIVFELENIWNNTSSTFMGPKIAYALLDEKGAASNIVLRPNQKANAKVVIDSLYVGIKGYNWKIKKEAWFDVFKKEPDILFKIYDQEYNHIQFLTPNEEGPYRLFYSIKDENGFFATANIPFYVLNPNKYE